MSRTRLISGVYMQVKNRELLLTLIKSKGVSKRQVAFAAGYKSHSYMYKLLDGKAKTLKPEAAVRVAHYLGVDLELIFLPRLITQSEHIGSSGVGSGRRVVA